MFLKRASWVTFIVVSVVVMTGSKIAMEAWGVPARVVVPASNTIGFSMAWATQWYWVRHDPRRRGPFSLAGWIALSFTIPAALLAVTLYFRR